MLLDIHDHQYFFQLLEIHIRCDKYFMEYISFMFNNFRHQPDPQSFGIYAV